MGNKLELTNYRIALIILNMLSEQDMYGYQMIRKINRLLKDELRMKEGALYPILHEMVSVGLLTSYYDTNELGQDRKYYGITTAGMLQLSKQKNQKVAD